MFLKNRFLTAWLILLTSLSFSTVSFAALSEKELKALVTTIDERSIVEGDYKAMYYIESRKQKKVKSALRLALYRRDAEDKMLMLVLQPVREAGKGYLILKDNYFFYDASVRKWNRQTSSDRVGGSNTRSKDYGKSRYSTRYDASYVKEEKLGKFSVDHIKLVAKKGEEVAFPIVHFWVDKKTGNQLKIQEHSLSNRLLRTLYFPKWRKVFNEKTKKNTYIPKEIRIYDELEKGSIDIMMIEQIELAPQPPNIFTKAWLESKSR